MEKYILSIDQGTSGTKSVIFNDKGELICKSTAEIKSYYPSVGFVEQDPDELYTSVLLSIQKCLEIFKKEHNGKNDEIVCCGISNQRETFIVWDKEGKQLHNAIVWQCKRSTQICERMKSDEQFNIISEKTGLIIDPYFSGTKMIWLYQNNPILRKLIDSGDAYFGTVDTWLLFKLTKGKSYLTDYTNASRTLFFNIIDLNWDKGLLQQYKLQNLNLPEVKASSYNYGSSNFNGLFPNEIPITGMIGDSHAAAFGEECFKAGDAKVTLGTGSSILMNTGEEIVKSKYGMMTTICWSSDKIVNYALEGVIVSNGSTIVWLRDQLGIFKESKDTEIMAQSIESSNGVFVIPSFSGLGAPFWKMDAKAVISGLTFGSDRNHIVRAALEAIAFQIKAVISAMENDSEVKISKLKVDGGMVSNKFVIQMIADLLETEVENIGIEDVSALGAAYMAGLGAGIYSSLDDLKKLKKDINLFNPKNNEKLKSTYQNWLAEIDKII
ncbi:MAG: glycerol kinase GlpK [Melioribacteraceae bacterium]|nr:glycerol kinase GlpK [Melioribacteraceae bacterium]